MVTKIKKTPFTKKVRSFIKKNRFFIISGAILPIAALTFFLTQYQQDIRQRASGESLISIIDFGATPDDTTDDTAAINQAISAARSQGKTVFVPTGKFFHTRFNLDGVQMTGQGNASILYAPDPNNIQIILQGNNPSLSNMKVAAATTTRSNTDKYSVYIENATNYVVDHLTVDGANDAGILSYKSSNGQITDNVVQNTLADAIHITGGSHDIYVARNIVRNPGDDMIAVVSYNNGQCDNQGGYDMVYNVLIEDNDVANQTGGRGISIVGGKDVTIRNNKVGQTQMAGLYLASESSYNTCGISNVRIENNYFDGVSIGIGHPAILIYADSGQTIQNIMLNGNTIANSPTKTGLEVRNASNNIALINNIFTNTREGISKSSSGNVYCSTNTFNGNNTPSTQCGGNYNFTVSGSSVTPIINTPTPISTITTTPITPTTTPIISTTTPSPTVSTPTPNIAPTVKISSPLNGASVRRGKAITIYATATDDIQVLKVEFYVNGELKCTDTTANYTCRWSVPNISGTSYTVSAKAYDNNGNQADTSIKIQSR